MTLKLIIGNKNYSSWSMRPWIGLKAAGIAFDEEVIPLYVEGSKEKILRAFARRQGAGADRRRDAGVGVARDPRIRGGEIPRRRPVAVRSGGARACARDLDRDACGLRARCAPNAA